jgi:hypothetical protein
MSHVNPFVFRNFNAFLLFFVLFEALVNLTNCKGIKQVIGANELNTAG